LWPNPSRVEAYHRVLNAERSPTNITFDELQRGKPVKHVSWTLVSEGGLETMPLIQLKAARPVVADLVRRGELEEVAVEGWTEPGHVLPGAAPRRPTRTTATLVSPFDSLVWDRARTRRVFDFEYRIEVYVPEPQRVHAAGSRLLGHPEEPPSRCRSGVLYVLRDSQKRPRAVCARWRLA
jgi:Winged helix DNA-binding domain